MNPMNRHERSILTLTGYGHFLSHFNMLVFPAVLLPLSRHLGLDLAGLLLLARTPKTSSPPRTPSHAVASGRQAMPSFAVLLAAMMLGGVVYRATAVSLPAYFELKNSGLFDMLSDNVAATSATSLIYLVGMLGQYTGGRAAERMALPSAYLLFHGLTIPAALCMASTAHMPLIAAAMTHSFFLLGMQPIENTLVARLTPRSLLHSAYGLNSCSPSASAPWPSNWLPSSRKTTAWNRSFSSWPTPRCCWSASSSCCAPCFRAGR